MNLIDVTKAYAIEDQCRDFLEGMRWLDGPCCPVCGNDKISRITRETKGKNDGFSGGKLPNLCVVLSVEHLNDKYRQICSILNRTEQRTVN
jgi:hypothetical protein